ncbi:Homoserine/homoserine lactone efflux protein [Posidoniimonas polymericola]|uniref:Homoserine/homoserine lactone efflux protein n=1 Tax=Posidoniimonas polymericola TaxID=2528002 RepID=A0A5C5ZER7_9BACT|nr:LysE family translocator [Posidoniimonas polymericola]TWT85341.1 Homoserine/homoserine lactone efflux protein [Posidoniimonas polymericola]
MPSSEQLLGFVLASCVLIAAPGPDLLGVLSLGLSRGRRAGVGFAIGCALGCLSHTLWAVVGISALIAASEMAFSLLKFAGAAYLVYLAIGALRSGGSFDGSVGAATNAKPAAVRTAPYVLRGFLANALNPKVALFFLALVPQFMDPAKPAAPQAALLGGLFCLLTMAAFSAIGAYAGVLGRWLAERTGLGRWLDRAAGCVFLALAGKLLWAKR